MNVIYWHESGGEFCMGLRLFLVVFLFEKPHHLFLQIRIALLPHL
jgi:hypothetical protein